MNVKMIVTDLDNTLLRTDKTISDYTASVFSRCREKSIKTVFATARPIRTVTHMCNRIKTDAAIYHNGAVITIGDAVYRQVGIKHELTKDLLLQTANRFKGMQISVEIDDVLYANFDVTKVWSNTTATMTDFSDLPDAPADKIIFGTAESRVVSEIEEMLTDELYTVITEYQLLMVMNINARKRNAIYEIAAYYDISPSDVAAFGDDFNDVEMLRDCGIGVAVANAIEEAKAAANYICDSNDNDGVVKWLEENVL